MLGCKLHSGTFKTKESWLDWYKFLCHMVWNKLCWGASYTVELLKQRNLYQSSQLSFVLTVPLCNLHPSIIYSIPCDRIVQRAYCWVDDQQARRHANSCTACRWYQLCWHFLGLDIVVVINHENDEAVELKIMQND